MIVGVLKDFHFASLHEPIKPLIVHLGEYDGGGTAILRIRAGMTKNAMAGLEKICKNLNPQFPFTYSFSDDQYQKLYKSEEIVSRLSNLIGPPGHFHFLHGTAGSGHVHGGAKNP